MHRIIALFLMSLLTFSCSNEIEYRTTAVQGTKNYVPWFADIFQAALTDNGGVKIIGVKNNESIVLSISDISEGTYTLGSSALSSAIFEDINFQAYSTLNNGDGEIVIQDYDEVNLTITGTFKFNSFSANGELVNFIHGVFYEVPIDSVTNELKGSNIFSATVNSNSVNVENIESDIIEDKLHILANYANSTFIEFYIPENIQVGSYTLNASTLTYANYGFADGVVAQSQYGTITILEHDVQFKKIKASFSFNTGNPYNIAVSNGNFIIYY